MLSREKQHKVARLAQTYLHRINISSRTLRDKNVANEEEKIKSSPC